ncbi:hypothetical protein NL676_009229 [Syzygium grande]|nr:hypothetical protein NL676_009229 [Syzygium grande]
MLTWHHLVRGRVCCRLEEAPPLSASLPLPRSFHATPYLLLRSPPATAASPACWLPSTARGAPLELRLYCSSFGSLARICPLRLSRATAATTGGLRVSPSSGRRPTAPNLALEKVESPKDKEGLRLPGSRHP